MTPYQNRLNPFIKRMAEDMQLRNFSPNTIDAYTFHVDKFCQHFGKPADQLGPEQIRQQWQRRPSWREVFERGVYQADDDCPQLHIGGGRAPPPGRIE